jgi:alpha,alpha-trehalase
MSIPKLPLHNLDFGIIGNGKTAALISRSGSIDWCCLPDFDSGSFFAHLLDETNGGYFAIEPIGDYQIQQSYLPHTNILRTRFVGGRNRFELLDFMPRYMTEDKTYHCPPDILRFIRVLSGRPKIRIDYNPRPNWAEYPVEQLRTWQFLKHYTAGGAYESVYLYSDLSLEKIAQKQPILLEKDSFLMVSYNQKLFRPTLDWAELEMERTKVYWMGWISKTTVVTHYPEQIERSALVLKLLAHQKPGLSWRRPLRACLKRSGMCETGIIASVGFEMPQ